MGPHRQPINWFLSLVFILLSVIANAAVAQDTNVLEEFVRSTDREVVLKKLVPGTQEYYFLHSLHYQNTQQLDKVDKTLAAWEKRLNSRSQQWQQIQHRQILLKYSEDPQATLDYLQRELGLNFNHQRERATAERKLPTKLDPKLIDTDVLLKKYLTYSLDRITSQGLRLLADKKLNDRQRRVLLKRLDRPDFPGLVGLIATELKSKDAVGFGKLPIHRQLTLKQLDELVAARPNLSGERDFVNIYLSKLRPSEDVNWVTDRKQRREYLDRLKVFTEKLPANFNSLKANVLFQILQLNLKEEKFDKKLFLAYLKLPRRMNYVNQKYLKTISSKSYFVNFSSDYSQFIQMPPIRGDESVIEAHLRHFLKGARDYEGFTAYLDDQYLKSQFATTKILAGVGDVEKWASMLTPSQYKSLLERVDIDFSPSNPEFFAADAPVSLELDLKNTNKLIVKIFEINTLNFYKKYRTEIDTDINLDGLTANHEQTYTYDAAPAVRSRKKFEFPELKDRGVYVIDFIAGGKSSRALVRKGRLQLVNQATAAGHALTILNSDLDQIVDASVWVDGRRFKADKSGLIMLPFSTQPGMRAAIISSGDFHCLQKFKQSAESYQFSAAMLLDRENLLTRNTAKVIIRPSVTVNNSLQAPVGLLTDLQLNVTVVDLDGVTTTKNISDFKLHDDQETEVEFAVPPRANLISLGLSAKIKNVSRGKKDSLSAGKSYQINQIDSSATIQDFHLVPTSEGYFIEALGKTGEIRAGQAVRLGVQVDAFTQKVFVDLQSDKRGLIELGPLANVRSIEIQPTVGQKKTWALNRQDQTYLQTLQVAAETAIELPAPAGINQVDSLLMSLLEIRGGSFVSDLTKSVSVKKGLVKIKPLPPGDYRLRLTAPITPLSGDASRDILIRVTDGKLANGVLVSPTRHLEARVNPEVQIATIAGNKKTVRIELENASETTRVHVIATRYQPAFDAYATLASVRPIEPWNVVPSVRRTVYQSGRTIGEEYEYILRRKYQKKFPGNMLTRPSLLLNPWAVRETSNQAQDAKAGDDFVRKGNEDDRAGNKRKPKDQAVAGTSDFANLDYLGDGSVLLVNLRPNKAGVIEIDRSKLGPNQHVRVVAVNGMNTVQRNINFGLQTIKPRDSRLADALDPKKHYSQSKQTQVLKDGDSLKIDDIVSAEFQIYDDLKDIFTLLETLNKNTHLNKFRFILDWSQKKEAEKNELYSKYACHELNFWLSRKDKDYFEKVVVPHIENKRSKTFMDHYLLKHDLNAFANPWEFARLNTAERILLAEYLKDQRADLLRSVDESYWLNPITRTNDDRFYDIAIRGLGLSQNQELLRRKGKLIEESEAIVLDSGFESYGSEIAGRELAERSKVSNGAVVERRGSSVDGVGGTGGFLYAAPSKKPMPAKPSARYRTEIQKRYVPRTKMVPQSRTRQVMVEGRMVQQNYTVQVPVTEMAEENYSFLVPAEGEQRVKQKLDLPKDASELSKLRDRSRRLYRRLAPTQEWIENDYYLISLDEQSPELVGINRFWRDLANHKDGPFLSPHFVDAHTSFTEMMFALAVLDLPISATDGKTKYKDRSMTYTAAGPSIALHQQVRGVKLEEGNTKILISENFFQQNDRYRYEEGVRYDKFISKGFIPHTLYGSQVVVTNTTSTPRSVELLIQIPEGSIACSGSQTTRTIKYDLAGFSTQTFDYSFYFPKSGGFSHYPAHVSAAGKALAVADGIEFEVVDEKANVDESSWNFVSQNGEDDQVIEFINRENVQRLDLNKIAFRMADEEFFKRAIETLRKRFVYSPVLWSYGIKHNDAETIREYMTYSNKITNNLGLVFDSDLVTIDPVQRRWYQHREYWPLVNARAHQLGADRRILNPNFAQQYRKLLLAMAYRRDLSDDSHLVLTYYMLLQDRVEAALEHFDKAEQAKLDYQMQYDYCDAYLDFYREDPASAAKKASKWAEYPVDHWRKRFQEILNQVDQINAGAVKAADADDAGQQQTELAAKSESIDLEVAGGQAKLTFQNVKQATVNFYEMDIEQLFSRSPFAQNNLEGFSLIRPNMTTELKLRASKKGQGVKKLTIPDELKNKNVLIEVVAADQTRAKPLFTNSLAIGMFENYGQVQVRVEKTAVPLSKAYVKVYAQTSSGEVRFHKDGYTDLRGRFDYVSQSNRANDGITKYSILIMSEENGSVIRQANPPRE